MRFSLEKISIPRIDQEYKEKKSLNIDFSLAVRSSQSAGKGADKCACGVFFWGLNRAASGRSATWVGVQS
jgi:hypothetical protein